MVAGGTGWVGRRWLLGAFDDLDEPPTLRGRKRPRLGHEDEVADTGGVLLIVNIVLDRLAHDLAVGAVVHALLDLDDGGLVHLVGHKVTTCRLASFAFGGSALGVRGLGLHLPSSF